MDLLKYVIVSGAWDLGSFLNNSKSAIEKWGGAFIMLIGVVAIIVAAYQIISGLISHGKKQVNWGISIALLVIGGAFSIGGFNFVNGIASGGKKTIDDLGNGGLINLESIKLLFHTYF